MGDSPLLVSIATHARGRLHAGHMSSQSMSNTAWACAILKYHHVPLLTSIAASALHLNTYKYKVEQQDLANMFWAFATLSFSHAPLLTAISEASLPMLNDFTAQGLAMTAWSLSFAVQRWASLVGACGRVATTDRALSGRGTQDDAVGSFKAHRPRRCMGVAASGAETPADMPELGRAAY